MKYFIILFSLILFTLPSLAIAKDGTVTAAEGWSNSAGFQTSYDILTKSIIAELIEKKENGFYNGWNQNNSFITNIDSQSTTVGSQTIFNGSTLENVVVTTTNCGDSSNITSIDSEGSNSVTGSETTCAVENNNATNP